MADRIDKLRLYAAGNNDVGQLGTGTTGDVADWTEMKIPQYLQDGAAIVGLEYFPVSVSVSGASGNQHTAIVLDVRVKEGP